MFRVLMMCSLCMLPLLSAAQEKDDREVQEALEKLIENSGTDADYSDLYAQLSFYLKAPLDINRAGREELHALFFLSPMQVDNLVRHRETYGELLSLLELQTIPGWDPETISKTICFVKTEKDINLDQTPFLTMLAQSRHDIFLLLQSELQKRKGFLPQAEQSSESPSAPVYKGNPQRMLTRYRMTYGNRFSLGLLAEKDAGEPLGFKNGNKGFDYYSWHFFYKPRGLVQGFIIGDYQVTFGQGLTIGTGMSFGKSALVLNNRRNFSGFMPYRSVNENEFLRGFALVLGNRRSRVLPASIKLHLWASCNRIDASLSQEADGSGGAPAGFNSMISTGLHRTTREIEQKDALACYMAGSNLSYTAGNMGLSFTAVYTAFDKPLIKDIQPYQYFDFRGKSLGNYGLGYHYLFRNFSFYGETSVSGNNGMATLNGLLASLAANVDISLVYRHYGKKYQALFSNAFGETSGNNNEQGIYTGISIKPLHKWVINAYADLYRSAWLRYLVDAPSRGTDLLTELQYNYSKSIQLYIRYRNDRRDRNAPGNENGHFDHTVPHSRQSLRFHAAYKISDNFSMRTRVEQVWYTTEKRPVEKGLLMLQDLVFKPLGGRLSITARFSLFSTGGYYSRVYAYENELPYVFSIPALQDNGMRWYCMVNYTISRHAELWLRYARSLFPGMSSTGSGNDEVKGSLRSDVKLQLRLSL